MDQVENIEPAVAEAVRPTKRHAPLPPMSLSPVNTSTPVGKVPSPIKMMKVDEEVDTPGKKGEPNVVEVTTLLDAAENLDGESGRTTGSREFGTERGKNAADSVRQVSSAKLVLGKTASTTSDDVARKSTPGKVAIVYKPSPSSVSKSALPSSADDDVANEPTRQPVAARLAAWQTKQVASTTEEPLAVSSRVKNYERQITTVSASDKAKTPQRLRSGLEAASTKSTLTKMSPVRGGGAVRGNSPMKSVKLSPQKLSPATRAIQEKLIQKCEAGTKNEAVDRERKERADELTNVENRWQHKSDTATCTVSFVDYYIPVRF